MARANRPEPKRVRCRAGTCSSGLTLGQRERQRQHQQHECNPHKERAGKPGNYGYGSWCACWCDSPRARGTSAWTGTGPHIWAYAWTGTGTWTWTWAAPLWYPDWRATRWLSRHLCGSWVAIHWKVVKRLGDWFLLGLIVGVLCFSTCHIRLPPGTCSGSPYSVFRFEACR